MAATHELKTYGWEPRPDKEFTMSDQEKLQAVQDYLQTEFPGSKIEIKYEPAERFHAFEILHEGTSHRAILVEAFLSIFDASQIPAILREFTLAEHLRALCMAPVVVTPEGLKLLGD
jgi:hypothetical protein